MTNFSTSINKRDSRTTVPCKFGPKICMISHLGYSAPLDKHAISFHSYAIWCSHAYRLLPLYSGTLTGWILHDCAVSDLTWVTVRGRLLQPERPDDFRDDDDER